MAVTFTRVTKRASGSRYIIAGDLALDNSYPTGGYAVTPALFGHRNSVTSIDTTISTGGFLAVFVPPTSKLKFFKVGAAGALTECATTDLNTDTIRIHVTGK
jgi:hypothetical protein